MECAVYDGQVWMDQQRLLATIDWPTPPSWGMCSVHGATSLGTFPVISEEEKTESDENVPSAASVVHHCLWRCSLARLTHIMSLTAYRKAVVRRTWDDPVNRPDWKGCQSTQELPLNIDPYKSSPWLIDPVPVSKVIKSICCKIQTSYIPMSPLLVPCEQRDIGYRKSPHPSLQTISSSPHHWWWKCLWVFNAYWQPGVGHRERSTWWTGRATGMKSAPGLHPRTS